MQSGQGFAFGKTLVTRHLARLHFTQSRLILNQPSQDAKTGLIYKKSHRVRGAAAPRKRSNPFFAAACTSQKTLCAERSVADPPQAAGLRHSACAQGVFCDVHAAAKNGFQLIRSLRAVNSVRLFLNRPLGLRLRRSVLFGRTGGRYCIFCEQSLLLL